jgi:hypothetical protein
MTHEERMQIAREVVARMVEKYGEQVSVVAAYGSVAKGEDSTYSDLDLWVATATSEPIEDVRFFVYKGMPVSINWDTEGGRIKSAGLVALSWPIDADELRSYLVLFEREGSDFLERLGEAASNLREEDFITSIRKFMVRTCETANKVRNAWEAGDHYRLLVNGRWLVWATAMIIGLLNRRYYPGGRGFYQMSKEMPKQPRDYARLLDLVGGFSTVEGEVVYRAAGELWENLCELVRSEGIEWENNEIPL